VAQRPAVSLVAANQGRDARIYARRAFINDEYQARPDKIRAFEVKLKIRTKMLLKKPGFRKVK
jgi:hypothetical protein